MKRVKRTGNSVKVIKKKQQRNHSQKWYQQLLSYPLTCCFPSPVSLTFSKGCQRIFSLQRNTEKIAVFQNFCPITRFSSLMNIMFHHFVLWLWSSVRPLNSTPPPSASPKPYLHLFMRSTVREASYPGVDLTHANWENPEPWLLRKFWCHEAITLHTYKTPANQHLLGLCLTYSTMQSLLAQQAKNTHLAGELCVSCCSREAMILNCKKFWLTAQRSFTGRHTSLSHKLQTLLVKWLQPRCLQSWVCMTKMSETLSSMRWWGKWKLNQQVRWCLFGLVCVGLGCAYHCHKKASKAQLFLSGTVTI